MDRRLRTLRAPIHFAQEKALGSGREPSFQQRSNCDIGEQANTIFTVFLICEARDCGLSGFVSPTGSCAKQMSIRGSLGALQRRALRGTTLRSCVRRGTIGMCFQFLFNPGRYLLALYLRGSLINLFMICNPSTSQQMKLT